MNMITFVDGDYPLQVMKVVAFRAPVSCNHMIMMIITDHECSLDLTHTRKCEEEGMPESPENLSIMNERVCVNKK